MYKIGIDVGGTNTDAVILDHQLNLIHSVKVPTTDDIQTGIASALNKVLAESAVDPTKVTHAMLGTTQCTNAIVERKKLAKVGVLRLGYPATASVLPYTAWPKDLVATLSETYALAHGGYEYDGQPLTALDEEELRGILASWRGEVEAIAVIGVFSSLKNDQELFVQALAKEVLGADVPVSCSSMIGSVGLIERENATILNAALHKVIKVTSEGFEQALEQEKIHHAQVYLCQNDGTLMSLTYAKQFPILTIACGPTNSIRGASYLAGLKDAVVLDVGGTTSDIGVLVDGFPRESSLAVDVGGVRTNFRMPDIVSIGVGGTQLTTTDIAVRLGHAQVGDPSKVAHLDQAFAEKVYQKIGELVSEAIDRMKTSSADVTVVLVGGGSIIIPEELTGVKALIRNENGAVANAIGASIAQISGQYEQIYVYSKIQRDAALADAQEKAVQQAELAGAVPGTIELVEVEETPLAYHPENATRLRVKVVGNMY